MVQAVFIRDVETLIPEDEFIYSSTDLKGRIIEANDLLLEISGYTREEMVGQPHKMIRHPDMPKEAFADMWKNLQAGRPWQGLVKNRRKDGGYYWVIANVAPIRERGRVVGYQSIRTRPSREQVAAASAAYKQVREGDKSLKVDAGRAVQVKSRWRELGGALGFRVSIGMVLLLATSVMGGAEVLWGTGGRLLQDCFGAVCVAGGLYALTMLLGYVPQLLADLRQVEKYLDGMLESGDLLRKLATERADIVGRVGRKLGLTIAWFQATLQCIQDAVKQVEDATEQVQDRVKQIDQAANSQSVATNSVAAAVEEMTMSISEVANHLRTTEAAVTETGRKATDGSLLSERATGQIEHLAGAINGVSGEVEALGVSTDEVGAIAGVIREIADQTNLLALNASIEAARAGQAGRGFAVVANEVRMLADRTMQATKKIDGLIVTIRGDSDRAVTGMRAGTSQVQTSVELVQEAERALKEINEFMSGAVRKVTEISVASTQQTDAMRDIGENIAHVAAMTEESMGMAQSTSLLMTHLDGMVGRVKKAVAQYEV